MIRNRTATEVAPQGGDEEEQQTRETNTYRPFYNPLIHPGTVEVYAYVFTRASPIASHTRLSPLLSTSTPCTRYAFRTGRDEERPYPDFGMKPFRGIESGGKKGESKRVVEE
jgi:hypothetical protein